MLNFKENNVKYYDLNVKKSENIDKHLKTLRNIWKHWKTFENNCLINVFRCFWGNKVSVSMLKWCFRALGETLLLLNPKSLINKEIFTRNMQKNYVSSVTRLRVSLKVVINIIYYFNVFLFKNLFISSQIFATLKLFKRKRKAK